LKNFFYNCPLTIKLRALKPKAYYLQLNTNTDYWWKELMASILSLILLSKSTLLHYM
jgi:hypothetical protein